MLKKLLLIGLMCLPGIAKAEVIDIPVKCQYTEIK